MQHASQPLFATEFTEAWTNAQQRRGEFLAVWLGELRDRVRAALGNHESQVRQGAHVFLSAEQA